ncbi:hypothetical protein CC1G_00811 [Coprinopsis cinerea okayama7|uniref:Uncharacterized protein n=1 Tax=Coprinopsis cinerea (strain Okayama-7 / 130 / ATCC MYA-4618 / FGSC 9003) TaxID=240176 RepID=A8N8T6_COPC7|nr:hypothetical protein CC1G_00811 [Coprinopsis cinerea okayama7\|eukprot:XP_001831264.1 hypothetical protein CC1G_00811 [Coprinopsis cinerea okayama7\
MAMNQNDATFYSKAASYAFLSQPPPQKKRPTLPLPSPPTQSVENPVRQRSTTFSATISAWAAHVQPGSPAPPTPCSPHRRGSVSSRRRVSGGIGHGRVASSPFVITNTPTTASHKTFDFTAVGYNNIFLNLPPETPSPLLREKAMRDQALIEAKLREKERAKEESKERKGRVMKKIKSLTTLRSRSKSISKTAEAPASPPPPMPTSTKVKSKKSSAKPSQKKKVYGPLVRAPPTLQNELALMQFADGGRMEDHIHRTMTGADGAVGDVYRDGKGGIWWDREEQMEYRGLLVPSEGSDKVETEWEDDKEPTTWVQFQSSPVAQVEIVGRSSEDTLVEPEPALKQKGKEIVFERRESASTLSSQDSDLDPTYMMQTEQSPAYHDERVLDFDLRASSNATETLKANNAASKRNGMILCLPARPFRAAKHLRKPEYMVDLQAFGVIPKSPKSPKSPRFSTSFGPAVPKPKGKARRRPAPLKISPAMTKLRRVVAVSSPGSAVPPLPPVPPRPSQHPTIAAASRAVSEVQQQQLLIKEGKQEFMVDSFQPEVSRFDDDSEYDFVGVEHLEAQGHKPGLKQRRGSRLDLRGMFGKPKPF